MKSAKNTQLHTIANVMALLSVSRVTVYRLAKAGEIVQLKIGRKCVRITDESLVAYLARQAGGA